MSAELDNLIYSMNDTANDGQDLAMNLRELIADLPATSSLAQDLASNLSLFGRVLRELALYLGTPAAPFSSTCIEVIEVTMDHVESLFDQVDDILYKFEKDPDKDFRRAFRDSKVLTLSAKLESSRLTLGVMLAILQLRALTNLQEMEGGDDRAMRHRIKDLKLEAQSMILDESWARQKEKLMDSGELDNDVEKKPLMPRHTITESAAAVTLLLDQLTVRGAERSRGGGRDKSSKGRPRSYSQPNGKGRGHDDSDGSRSPSPPPKSAPPNGGEKNSKNAMFEELAKAALAAGVLSAWRSRSKVPVPAGVKDRKNRMKEKGKPKHGQGILNGVAGKIETIAPAAIAAGAFEVFRHRNNNESKGDKGKRFFDAAKSAAIGK